MFLLLKEPVLDVAHKVAVSDQTNKVMIEALEVRCGGFVYERASEREWVWMWVWVGGCVWVGGGVCVGGCGGVGVDVGVNVCVCVRAIWPTKWPPLTRQASSCSNARVGVLLRVTSFSFTAAARCTMSTLVLRPA
jgi:hypothetical protein